MSDFSVIKNQIDAEKLMKAFHGFHDAIIKEIKILNTEYVNQDGSACLDPNGYQFDALFLFQTQMLGDTKLGLQILFEKVLRMNLVSPPYNYSTELWSGYIKVVDDLIYFFTDAENYEIKEWLPGGEDSNDIIWISSKSAKWRSMEDEYGSKVEPPFSTMEERW